VKSAQTEYQGLIPVFENPLAKDKMRIITANPKRPWVIPEVKKIAKSGYSLQPLFRPAVWLSNGFS